MNKQVILIEFILVLWSPASALAQNVFPSTGKVGIGTVTPTAPLHVMGPGGGYGAIFDATPGMNFVMLKSRNGGGNYGSVLQFMDNSTDSGAIRSVASGGLRFATLGADRLTIDGSGNVGIGTTMPTLRLDVSSRIRLRGGASADTAGAWLHDSTKSGDMAFVGLGPNTGRVGFWGTGSGWGLSMDVANGNVGIGTTTPGAKLTVIGNAQVSGNVGIGTANPARLLDISGNGGATEVVISDPRQPVDQRAWRFANAGLLAIEAINDSVTGGLNVINFLRNGNVGIGTTSPQAKLDVAGTIMATVVSLTSDRNAKQDFQLVSPVTVLAKVSALPVSTWSYTNSPSVRHIGPTAQDFKTAFGLGEDDKHIGAGDGIGVALVGIQGLHRELREARAALAEQGMEIDRMRREMAALRSEVLPDKVSSGVVFDTQDRARSGVGDSNGRPE